MVWVLPSRLLIWSFCGSYPLFFSLQANFCFCIRRVLTSLNDGGEVRLRSFSINQPKISLQVIEHRLGLQKQKQTQAGKNNGFV